KALPFKVMLFYFCHKIKNVVKAFASNHRFSGRVLLVILTTEGLQLRGIWSIFDFSRNHFSI
ncbi:TPA: hypothetical protein ACGZCP_005006, partial [Citrobacter freundii]